MKLIEQLGEDLAGMSVVVRKHADGIIVPATSDEGFDVSMLFLDGRYCVGFDKWGLDCFDPAEASIAAGLFAHCLSDQTRLIVTSRGGKDVSWTLEELQGGEWTPFAHISNWIPKFWLAKQVRCLRNNINLPGFGT